jgi:hypothetical protein
MLRQTLRQVLQKELSFGLSQEPQYLGRYLIKEAIPCLQIRFVCFPDSSTQYNLISPGGEETAAEANKIKFAHRFTFEEAYQVISWLKQSRELASLLSLLDKRQAEE